MQGMLLLTLLIFTVNVQGAQEWFSIERHGGCVPLDYMARLVKEFHEVRTPDDLAENYRQSGHEVLVQDYRDILISEASDGTNDTQELPPPGTRLIFSIDGDIRWMLFEKKQCEQILQF
ncbi:hypothetical protein [Endozoicomonas sp.]|uniref:hypothetical protein n=1 Tax=Endozoicomonas sp. TaxID=1892382 RepID=UPI003AF8B383